MWQFACCPAPSCRLLTTLGVYVYGRTKNKINHKTATFRQINQNNPEHITTRWNFQTGKSLFLHR